MKHTTASFPVLLASQQPQDTAILGALADKTCEVVYAKNETETLNFLHDQPVSAVLLGLSDSACQSILAARQNDPRLLQIPTLVITDANQETAQQMALQLGATDLLTRPLSLPLLQHRLQRVTSNNLQTALARQQCQIAQQAALLHEQELDDLTELYNKRAFLHYVQLMLDTDQEKEFIFGRWDLDRFKVFNDIFGVPAGDLLLSEIGRIMKKWQNLTGCLAGYLNADHFLFFMPMDKADIPGLLQAISNGLSSYPISFAFSPRIGIYRVLSRRIDVSLMCDRALLALRSIKGNFTESIAYYDDSMLTALLEEQELLSELTTALEERQFGIYLQPQYDLYDHTICGAECLVRWFHPKKGMISPGRFIPLCEKNGFITRLDEFVWEEACRLLRCWLDEGRQPMPISVNISRVDLYRPRLCERICELVARYQLQPEMLRLEITESAYMNDSAQLVSVVRQLREHGFFLEMDDFGSGYSSLNTLKNVPVDLLKLDLNFLQKDNADGRGGIILNSVVQMAHWLSLPVIAEGVETPKQADYLKTIGCRMIQGFLFAKPMPIADFEALLAQSRVQAEHSYFAVSSFFNSKEFWNPDAQATVVFNSFVGAAGLFEFQNQQLTAIRLNDKYFELTGFSREHHASPSNLLDMVYPEDYAVVLHMLETASSSDHEAVCEARWKSENSSGTPLWLRIRGRCIATNYDRCVIYAAIENITERKQLMDENLALNRHLTSIIGSVPGGIFTLEMKPQEQMAFTFINDVLPDMFGYSMQEFLTLYQHNVLAAVYPEDAAAVEAALLEVTQDEEKVLNLQYRHHCRDGSVIWVRLSGRLIHTQNGVPSICGIVQNMQAQKELEEQNHSQTLALQDALETRHSEDERNRLLVERTGTCVFDYDIPHDVLHFQSNFFNEGIKKISISGYLAGLSQNETIHPESRAALGDLIRAASIAPKTDCFVYRADNWGVGYRWSQLHYISVADKAGVMRRIVGQINDIQAEKEQETAMQLLAAQAGISSSADTGIIETVFQLLYNTDDLSYAIHAILASIGEAYQLSRIFIFEDSADHLSCSNTYEWFADGVAPRMDKLQAISIPLNGKSTAGADYFDQRGVFTASAILPGSLPDWIQTVLPLEDIYTLLHCAMQERGTLFGFIGFDDCRLPRHWSQAQINILSLVTKLIGEFLLKRRNEQASAFSESFKLALNGSASSIYIIDPDTYEIIYANRAMQSKLITDCAGRLCYTEFQHRSEPCHYCPIHIFRETGVSKAIEVLRPGGEWVLAQASTVVWNSREMMMLTAMDITSYKQAEVNLRTRNEEYRIVVSQSGRRLLRYLLSDNCLYREYDVQELLPISSETASTPEEVLKSGCIAKESEQTYQLLFEQIRSGIPNGRADVRVRCADRKYRWYRLDYTLVFIEGVPAHAILTLFDNTAAYEQELAYYKWQHTLDTVISDSTVYREVNLSTDFIEREEGEPRYRLAAQSGYSFSKVVAFCVTHFVVPADVAAYQQFFSTKRLLALYDSGNYTDFLEYCISINDHVQVCRVNVKMVKCPYTNHIKASFSFREKQDDAPSPDSKTDAATSLLHPNLLRESISALLNALRPEDAFAIFLIALNGSAADDEQTLRAAADTMQSVFRSCDIISRIRDSVFLVCLSAGMTESMVQYKAASLLHALQFRSGDAMLSPRIGIVRGQGRQEPERLYQMAEEALRQAQEAGERQFCILHCDQMKDE